jgi:hypothetical protein
MARPSWWERLRAQFRPLVGATSALVLVCAGGVGYWQHQVHVRNDVAKGLSVLANVASLSGNEALQNFDVIQNLSPHDDDELYTVLNQ